MDAQLRARHMVLVVEDNADARDVFAFALRSVGYAVREAENGAVGLLMMQIEVPAVVLTDLRMPEMDGMQLARELKSRAQFAPIPRLLLTATPLNDMWASLELFDAVLLKPISLEDLVQAIDKAVASVGAP